MRVQVQYSSSVFNPASHKLVRLGIEASCFILV